ncbi:Katanin p80 WD40 repeat-containing subunit B1 [Armadillidium nasatum]|uniref:Katanin p80 WD40 repeat-containing subunit B1 n=1 Tax=Armadillidium nasatum TaxID=96803 RepID=A0A5N5SY33_9CRUS|nr:Katanin p80 WD40 repeat-containing subunit B1 [Armadillidium nasatum]
MLGGRERDISFLSFTKEMNMKEKKERKKRKKKIPICALFDEHASEKYEFSYSLSGHSTAVECVRFGGSEELVCAGSLSGALKIWDLEATKIVRTLTGHKANIRSIDFHPYGDFICTGSLDTNIKLWDIRRKGCIFTYKGHNLTVNSLKFSPDGQWISSAGEDCAVKLWDLRAGKMLTEFSSHTGPVSDVEFHPHEFLLASASHDRTVNIWDLEKFSLVSTTNADTATEVLKVYGWEPSRTYDTVAMGWGKVQDIAIAQNQLIGAAFHGAYVSLYVIDLKRVQPFGGPQNDPASFKHGTGIRKSFIKDKSSGKANCESIKTEEASDTGGDEPVEDDPPPEITNLNDYKDIFQTHRELPPSSSMPSSDIVRPEPIRQNSAFPRSSTPEPIRKTSTTSMLPRPITQQRYDSNSNIPHSVAANPTPPTTLPNLTSDRRGSNNDLSSQQLVSPQRELPNSISSGAWSQPYRTRAVSESRREVSFSSNTIVGEQEQRYHIRHSPSEPYLVRQQSSPGPPASSSPPVQHNSPTLPHLNRTSSDSHSPYSSSRPERSSVTRPPYCRNPPPPPLTHGSSDSDCSYPSLAKSSPTNSGPKISYLGTPKESDYHQYNSDKLSDVPDYISSYSIRPERNNGLNIEDFLPVAHKLWQTKDLKTAVDHALNTGDQAILVDFLGILNLRPSIWNLDILTALLPPVSLLLQSKHESYVSCGCDALKLMIKNFAPMIKSNMQGPIHSVGVDISREERFNKCLECYNHMMSIKAFLLKRQTVPGKLGHTYRELVILMQAFD